MLIDIHVHCMRKISLPYCFGTEPMIWPEKLLSLYDQAGIAMGVLLPCAIPDGMHFVQSNEDILDYAEAHPTRFIPFCNLDPRLLFNDPDANFTYLMDYYRERGCKGIGEMTANLPFSDPRVRNLFRYAERKRFPVTIHIGTQNGKTYGLIDQCGLPGLEAILQECPELRILGHSQAFWSHISGDVNEQTWAGYPKGKVAPGGRIPELMRKYPNLLGDLSAGSGCNALARDPDFACEFLDEFQDRLFFGTDVCRPCNDKDVLILLKNFLGELLEQGRISESIYAKVTHLNAIRLLNLPHF